jgi:tetratricopeptide (TPR) repeat protein
VEAHPDFHVLRYEDFVDGRLDELNRYNGFEVPSDPDISDRRQKVLRSKAYGDWHKWFLPEDVEYFKGIYRNYLNRFRYDTTLQSSEPLDEATTVVYSIKVNNQARRTRWLPEFRTGSVTLSEDGEQFEDAKRALLNGKLDRAEEMVDNMLAANPRVAGYHYLRSRIMAKKGDYAQASEALRQAIAILPEEFEFHRLLSVALRKIGNKTEAAAAEAKARMLEGSSQKRRAMSH